MIKALLLLIVKKLFSKNKLPSLYFLDILHFRNSTGSSIFSRSPCSSIATTTPLRRHNANRHFPLKTVIAVNYGSSLPELRRHVRIVELGVSPSRSMALSLTFGASITDSSSSNSVFVPSDRILQSLLCLLIHTHFSLSRSLHCSYIQIIYYS